MTKLGTIKNSNILLLQSPIGNFFNELADFLSVSNNKVFSLILNGGDLFYSNNKRKVIYTDSIDNFSNFILDFFRLRNIKYIFLFGDTRLYHEKAIKIAKTLGIVVYVFEEGYLRPHFVTLEKNGVNNLSTYFKNIDLSKLNYSEDYSEIINKDNKLKYVFRITIFKTFIYYLMLFLYSFKFKNYIHHREKSLYYNIKYFIKGSFKYIYFKYIESNKIKSFCNNNTFFFVPLQLDFDSQVQKHSKYDNIEEFLDEIIKSFKLNSLQNDKLLIKLHPYSLGYKDYELFLNKLVAKYDLKERVFYIRTGDVGFIIKKSKGVVTINSTVGLSTLYHKKPLKIMGDSIYDIIDISDNKHIDMFWKEPCVGNFKLIENFLLEIFYKSQFKGSFYKDNTINLRRY